MGIDDFSCNCGVCVFNVESGMKKYETMLGKKIFRGIYSRVVEELFFLLQIVPIGLYCYSNEFCIDWIAISHKITE